MTIDAARFQKLLNDFNLEQLFNELGWDHISPKAYKQNDIVKALNGTTIEIIHTDAEGRMVLADTLTLAARAKPDLMINFATLTGSMATALGARYSGVLGNRDELVQRVVNIGSAFPLDEDYEAGLESKVADIKQCSQAGEADHILAARFLKRFVDDTPWLHIDLSSSRCEEGLGSVASDVTGFGVGWGVKNAASQVSDGNVLISPGSIVINRSTRNVPLN